MKSEILSALGEEALGRPSQVMAALAANERIKYYLSLLQMALERADHPAQSPMNLRQERIACGVDEPDLDDTVTAARPEGDLYRVPGCAKILERLTQELRTMAAPVLEEENGRTPPPELPGPFCSRLRTLLAALPTGKDDLMEGQSIRDITCVGGAEQDSIHQLVMDMHKRLNAMQAELAEERLDGAAVFGIKPSDRPLITAFMAGLNRTAPLKFNHPGLETTATRVGSQLLIQNDIGTTGAHVIVIHIEGLTVRVTYTDVHPERAEFFRALLKKYPVRWNEDRSGQLREVSEDANFTMLVGSYEAANQESLKEYLNFLGSRLVFLIDWNRARKQLRGFLRGTDAAKVLRWAAEAEVGQRGFLELGGAKIINQAIESVSGSAVHFGDRLCDVLGDEAAVEFIESVFREAAEGLKEHQSAGLIHDRVRAELQAYFSSEGQRLLELAREHAGIVLELALQVTDGVREITFGEGNKDFGKLARRARAFEHDADQLVIAAREAVRKRPEYSALFDMTESADDAADELEHIASLLGLLKASRPSGEALEALGSFGALIVEAAREWIKALIDAAHVKGAGRQEDANGFLLAVDRLLELEHQADDADLALTYAAVQRASNFRQLHLYSEIGNSLEAAADSLKSAGLIARDHLFASVLGA